MTESSPLRKSLSEDIHSVVTTKAKARTKSNSTKTLRDDFAMSALAHATSVYTKMTMTELDRLMGRKNYTKDEAVARLAYNMADAMLEAREI